MAAEKKWVVIREDATGGWKAWVFDVRQDARDFVKSRKPRAGVDYYTVPAITGPSNVG